VTKYRKIIFIALIATVFSTPCLADGNKLLNQCRHAIKLLDGETNLEKSEVLDAGQCMGYIKGVTESFKMFKLPHTCWPESGPSNAQAARIVFKYLSNNPEKLHEPEILVSALALSQAFPCK
jgi:hypothetical protein